MRIEANMKRWCVGSLALCVSLGAWSANEAPNVQAAVRVLLGQTVSQPVAASAAPAGASHSAQASGRAVVAVRKGETLARIVRAHFKDSPFREDFIYKAFVQLNPEAFPRKTHHIVRAGAQLQVPSHADLMGMAEEGGSAVANLAHTPVSAPPSAMQVKRWVRFP
jgi:Tfp pilus assembly protein FimV